MDTRFWGPSGWKFLHLITAIYPLNPSTYDKILMRDFMELVNDILPCKYCRSSFTKYSSSLDITPYLDDNIKMQEWIYKMHNKVNSKLRRQGFCNVENPMFVSVIKKYKKLITDNIIVILKNNNPIDNSIKYICNIGFEFLGSIIFNYQGYFANCYTSNEKIKIISTYHKFFNIIQPLLYQYISKLHLLYPDTNQNSDTNQNPDTNQNSDINSKKYSYKITNFKLRQILQQNEPYSKLIKWFWECKILSNKQEKYITNEHLIKYFYPFIVASCNNPIFNKVKSCRKHTKKTIN